MCYFSKKICTHVGFKSNRSIDFDFIMPDCSYSRIMPKNQRFKHKNETSKPA